MALITKECEICGDKFSTNFAQQKYCDVCGKDPERARRDYEWASARLRRHSGVDNTPKELVCEVCGKLFYSLFNRSYCGDACKEYARIRKAVCKACGKPLIESGNETGKGVCNEECAKELTLIREAERIQKAKDSGNYIQCKHCGKWFVSKSYSNEFCGNDCYKAHKAAELCRQEQKPPGWVDPQMVETRICPCCLTPFQCKRYENKIYCSKECRISMAKKTQASKQHEPKPDMAAATEPGAPPIPVHLCTECKTSQASCERFTSKFVYSPKGSKMKRVDGVLIVHECPKFTSPR